MYEAKVDALMRNTTFYTLNSVKPYTGLIFIKNASSSYHWCLWNVLGSNFVSGGHSLRPQWCGRIVYFLRRTCIGCHFHFIQILRLFHFIIAALKISMARIINDATNAIRQYSSCIFLFIIASDVCSQAFYPCSGLSHVHRSEAGIYVTLRILSKS